MRSLMGWKERAHLSFSFPPLQHGSSPAAPCGRPGDVLDMVRGWHSSPLVVAWRASTQPLSWSGVGIAPWDPWNV